MRAVICAAGLGERWGNYLGTRKHMAPVNGEPLLHRTVRQLRANGITDIRITNHPDHPYEVPGATCFPRFHPSAVMARKLTWGEWALADRDEGMTLLLLGDVFFSDEAMKIICTPQNGWVQFGRLKPSEVTGKPGAEMFGWQFHTVHHKEFIAAIERVEAARLAGVKTWNDWSLYCAMVGHDISTPPEDIRDWGRHVEIPDDGTDDFDFPDDYERFHYHCRRSSRRVAELDFYQNWFRDRMGELGLHPKLHRKPWEFASIAQVYHDRIGRGGRVLGFGVGKEPLPAWLAKRGARVVATDRPDPGLWLTRQHATGLDDLRVEGICDRDTFAQRVTYRPLDMNAIPEEYHGQFDMTWSASCFEHLGGIKAGLNFFAEQMKCLKPGGIAVHTTELNVSSLTETLDAENLCFFRAPDFEKLTARLKDQGDRLWPIDMRPGGMPGDQIIDNPPFTGDVHLQLRMQPHVFTSVLLIAARGL